MNKTSVAAMRQRLTLEEVTAVADGAGGSIVSWVLVAEVWAAIHPRSGVERVAAGGIEVRVTHEITIRHRPGVVPQQRFRLGARIFDIKTVIDVDEAHRFLVCLVEEPVA
jgi:SPP1 family predicted phage head-tail adaptor